MGFEPAFPPIKRFQTQVLKRKTTGNALNIFPLQIIHFMSEIPLPKTLSRRKCQCRIGQERLTKTSTLFMTTTMMMLTAKIADCRDMQYVVWGSVPFQFTVTTLHKLSVNLSDYRILTKPNSSGGDITDT